MPPIIATLVCIVFILYLIRLENKRDHHVSRAIWIPLIWILIIGSRGVSSWISAIFGPNGTKRARGSERKSTILCAVSFFRDRRGDERPGVHMQMVDNASTSTIENFLHRLGCEPATKERQNLLKAIHTD